MYREGGAPFQEHPSVPPISVVAILRTASRLTPFYKIDKPALGAHESVHYGPILLLRRVTKPWENLEQHLPLTGLSVRPPEEGVDHQT